MLQTRTCRIHSRPCYAFPFNFAYICRCILFFLPKDFYFHSSRLKYWRCSSFYLKKTTMKFNNVCILFMSDQRIPSFRCQHKEWWVSKELKIALCYYKCSLYRQLQKVQTSENPLTGISKRDKKVHKWILNTLILYRTKMMRGRLNCPCYWPYPRSRFNR